MKSGCANQPSIGRKELVEFRERKVKGRMGLDAVGSGRNAAMQECRNATPKLSPGKEST